jgi:hypothetical protein
MYLSPDHARNVQRQIALRGMTGCARSASADPSCLQPLFYTTIPPRTQGKESWFFFLSNELPMDKKAKAASCQCNFWTTKDLFSWQQEKKIDICGEGMVFGHYQMSIGFEPDGGCDGQEKKTGTWSTGEAVAYVEFLVGWRSWRSGPLGHLLHALWN